MSQQGPQRTFLIIDIIDGPDVGTCARGHRSAPPHAIHSCFCEAVYRISVVHGIRKIRTVDIRLDLDWRCTNVNRGEQAPILLLGRRPEAVAPNGAGRSTLTLWPTN